MKSIITKILIIVLLIQCFIQPIQSKSKKPSEQKKHIPLGSLTEDVFKQVFINNSQWDVKKPISVLTYHQDVTQVSKKGEIQPDFQTSHKNPKQSDKSYFGPYHHVAVFLFDIDKEEFSIGLDDFVIEFEAENPDQLELFVQQYQRKPNTIDEFIPMQDFKQQQIQMIKEKGLIEKEKSIDHVITHKEEYILMSCLNDNQNLQKITGKIYPLLIQDDPLEFVFYKDCKEQQKKVSPTLQVQTVHWCHHHSINESQTIWENNEYSKDYTENGDNKGFIQIDEVDPTIDITVKEGNQFIVNPKITKVGGAPKSSQNKLMLKKNKIGGYIDTTKKLTFQLLSLCVEKVGIEQYDFTVEFPPFDREITIRFQTHCENGNEISNFEDFPLIIGTNGESSNVVQWGTPQAEYNVDEYYLEQGNEPTILKQNDKSIKFSYDYTAASQNQIIQLDYHNPTITYDHSIVEIFYYMSPDQFITHGNNIMLMINMKCIKKGETYVEVDQVFDYKDKGILKQHVTYGFKKICTGFDYASENDFYEEEGGFTQFVAIFLIVAFLAYGIFCLKSGIQEQRQGRTQLPTHDKERVTELEDQNETNNLVQRKRVNE